MESQREPRADCRQQLVGEKLIGVRRGQPGHVRANASQILITHYWGADPCPGARWADRRLGLGREGDHHPQAAKVQERMLDGKRHVHAFKK